MNAASAGDGPPAPPHGEQEVFRSRHDGDEHADAEHDRDGLQDPRRGTEHEMVGADHRVEVDLGPEDNHGAVLLAESVALALTGPGALPLENVFGWGESSEGDGGETTLRRAT